MQAGAHGITIAVPKGRLFAEVVELFDRAGCSLGVTGEPRRLVWEHGGRRFLLAKPVDIPVYARYGVADVGIVGKDVLLEAGEDIYELSDLGIGACRLVVAGRKEGRGHAYREAGPQALRVATKYPRVAREFFASRGLYPDVVSLSGSIELAPVVGLADLIVDIVATGQTLRENGLVEYETIAPITARLVANRASLRLKDEAITSLLACLEEALPHGAIKGIRSSGSES